MMNKHASGSRFAAVALGVYSAAATGCTGTDAIGDVGALERAIERGQIEPNYPAVGSLTSLQFPTGYCTGTLIDRSWVLSAAHCFFAPEFRIGTSKLDFVSHAIDDRIAAPNNRDLELLHLAKPVPVEDDTPDAELKYRPLLQPNPGQPPLVNASCTGVGFGLHQEDDGSYTKDIKRSCTQKVVSADENLIVMAMDTGIPDHHDSGGPLICGDYIAGVVKTHGAKNWPDYNQETYTTVDSSWIASTIANYQGPKPPAPTLKPIFHLVSYSGPLCPAGSLELQDSTLRATEGHGFVHDNGQPLTCSLQLEVEVPAGKRLTRGTVYPNFELSHDELPASVELTYTLPTAAQTLQPNLGRAAALDGIAEMLKLSFSQCDGAERLPLRIEVSANVAPNQGVRLVSLSHDLAQNKGGQWSDCSTGARP